MKAVAVFPQKKQVEVIDVEPPQISSPTQVRIRMREIGVCGTDKEICAFLYGTPPSGSEYLVIGHESIGEVVEVGQQVQDLKPGDWVVPMVRRPCPHEECRACRVGRQDFCFTGDFTERGIKMAHGFMTEFVVDDERYMNRVPPELREVGVLVEPLTIAEKALAQVWQVQQRLPWDCSITMGKERGYCHSAVVLGAGPVGLLGAMALTAGGFGTTVYSLEPEEHPKAAFVRAIGATYVSAKKIFIDQLARQIGNIDLIYEATGASRLSFEIMKVLGTNGVFIFTGVPGRKGPVEVDTDLIMRNLVLKNQVVYGTVNAGRDDFQAAIRDLGVFLERWPAQTRSLLTGRYPVEKCQQLLLGQPDGIKNTIAFG